MKLGSLSIASLVPATNGLCALLTVDYQVADWSNSSLGKVTSKTHNAPRTAAHSVSTLLITFLSRKASIQPVTIPRIRCHAGAGSLSSKHKGQSATLNGSTL